MVRSGSYPIGELIVTFNEMAALEPGLLTLAADVTAGRQTMTDIALASRLVPLVGRHAAHPRLRLPGMYGVAYRELQRLDRQRREGLQVQG